MFNNNSEWQDQVIYLIYADPEALHNRVSSAAGFMTANLGLARHGEWVKTMFTGNALSEFERTLNE